MSITTKLITNKQTWEKFVLSQPEANFLQSWNWGEFHKKLGHKIFRLSFYTSPIVERSNFAKVQKLSQSYNETIRNVNSHQSDVRRCKTPRGGDSFKNANKDSSLGVDGKRKLCGVCLIIKENAKRATYLTVPGGPLIDWQAEELVRAGLKEVKKIAKEESVAFVRVRPQIQVDPKVETPRGWALTPPRWTGKHSAQL